MSPGAWHHVVATYDGATIRIYIDGIPDPATVAKSDPITFTSEEIGWYLVQVNANDLATTGAVPRWLLVTLLLPEAETTPEMAQDIMAQIDAACRELHIAVVGGHTEVTHGLDRPIVVGHLLGEASKDRLVTTAGAQAGDDLLLVHANPRDVEGMIYPAEAEQARLWDEVRQPDEAPELQRSMDGVQARLIVFGHFHYMFQRSWREKLLVDVACCSLPGIDHDRRARLHRGAKRQGQDHAAADPGR